MVLLSSYYLYRKNKMSQIRHKCIDEHNKRDYYGYIKLTVIKTNLTTFRNMNNRLIM